MQYCQRRLEDAIVCITWTASRLLFITTCISLGTEYGNALNNTGIKKRSWSLLFRTMHEWFTPVKRHLKYGTYIDCGSWGHFHRKPTSLFYHKPNIQVCDTVAMWWKPTHTITQPPFSHLPRYPGVLWSGHCSSISHEPFVWGLTQHLSLNFYSFQLQCLYLDSKQAEEMGLK